MKRAGLPMPSGALARFVSRTLLPAMAVAVAVAAGAQPAAAVSQVLRLLPSSHECPESAVPGGANATFYRTCTFRNLYLWQGMAYYLVGGAHVKEPHLEQLGMRFELWMTVEGPDAVLGFVQPIGEDEFLELLADSSPSSRAPAAVDAEIPLAYFWKARKVTGPPEDNNCDTVPDTQPGTANYYHFMAEWMPALSYTLCEQFDHCSYADRSRLQIIDVNKRMRCHERELYPPFFQEAISCLSNKPFHHINGTALRSQLTLVRTGWLGLGPRCRGVPPGCYKRRSGRLPPTPELTATWRRIAGQCYGFDDNAQASLQPLQLLVVDRLYGSGRHMLNINTIMRALQSRYSPQHVRAQLAYSEGLSLHQQAAVFAQASVLLHVHGAALANYFFLPKNAVTVQLAPLGDLYNPTMYSKLLQRDLAGVSDVETLEWQNSDPTRVHLITEQVEASLWRKPELRRFLNNREVFGEFAATYRCSKELMSKEERKVCESLLYRLNIHVDLDAVFNLTDAAISRAFEKQGREVPAGLFASAASTARESAEAETEGRRAGLVTSAGLLVMLQMPGGAQLLLVGGLLGALAAAAMLSFVRRRK